MIRTSASLIAFFALLAFVPAEAAQSRKKKVEAPPPPPFRVEVATRPMAMQRLGIQIPTETIIGKFIHDPFCIPNLFGGDLEIKSDHAFKGIPDANYFDIFSSEAAAAGYALARGQGDLFGDTKPELIVGASIVSIQQKGCGVTRPDVESTVLVDWQVYDPLDKKVVFRVTVQGTAKVEGKALNTGYGLDAVVLNATRASFRASAKAVLADTNFVEALRDQRGGRAPSPGNELFPEAQNNLDAAASPHQAEQSSNPGALEPLHRITQIPLSTTDFRKQVSDIQKQVVTIRTATGHGSGFYIADGLVLTNAHVISGHTDGRIVFLDKREIPFTLLSSNERRDTALLKTDNVGLPGLPLRLEQPELASTTFVIGTPIRDEDGGTITSGVISSFRASPYGPLIQSDVAVTSGNSGGPMFDDKGNVIGQTVMVKLNDQGQQYDANLFIPIADAVKALGIGFTPAPETVSSKSKQN
jgi:S1-C subfamily serine protease